MKNILILGAGRGQAGLYAAAREMGYKSIAVSIPGKYPCFELADEISYTDVTDIEAVLKAAKEYKADAVVSACIDITLPAIGWTCDKLGLCGISYDAAIVSTNKYLMKEAFEKNGVRTALHVRILPGDDPVKVCSRLRYPLITKAVDLCGSKGINIVTTEADLNDAVEATMSETNEGYCIAEEYLDGYEFSATAFVANGEILFVLPKGDVRYGENDEIPVGHYLPFDADPEILADADKQIRNGIHALGLDNCAVNADLMLMDGKVYILEMTGRLGANCIPELTSIYMGYDINRMIIETALGESSFVSEIEPERRPCIPCYAQMVVSEKEGTLQSTNIENDVDADILLFSEPGDHIRKFASTSDCVGQIVTKGSTLEEARSKAEKAVKKIHLVIQTDE